MNTEDNRIVNGLDTIIISTEKILFHFNNDNLRVNYLDLSLDVDNKLIDFLVNCLFLGKLVCYSENLDEALKIKQSEYREIL